MEDYAATIKRLSRTCEDLKGRRLTREGEWQMIADHFAPRKDFSIATKPTELRRRRLTSSVPAVALRRCAALLVGYLIDPTQPFIKPNTEAGLVASGRSTSLDSKGQDYLGMLSWAVFDRLMNARSGFLSATSRLAVELSAFGTGVLWTGRKRGFGPTYQCRPLRSCWIDQDEEGQVNTLLYEFTLPLWRAIERFPNAAYVDGWDTKDEAKLCADVTLQHMVEPRKGGLYGGFSNAKPFAEWYFSLDKKVVLAESGYDSFPFAVPRLEVEDGSVYGTGLAWHVLPDAIALSTLQQGVETAVDLRVLPPVMYPARMFGKPLDRRPGAPNHYDPGGLGFMDARTAFQRLDIGGDPAVGVEYSRYLVQNIEQGLFVDWLRLRETGNMTAEEVVERRNMRMRSMSGLIPGLDRDLMGAAADRTLDILLAEHALPPAPPSIAGANVEWDYAGPLAMEQLQRQADGIGRLFNLALAAQKLDPAAPYVLAVDEGLRAVAEAWGAPVGALRGREAYAAKVADMEARRNAAETIAGAQGAATTLRDAGQGVNSLATAAAAAGQAPQPQQGPTQLAA